MTVEKDTAPTSYMQPAQVPVEAPNPSRPLDARQALKPLQEVVPFDFFPDGEPSGNSVGAAGISLAICSSCG